MSENLKQQYLQELEQSPATRLESFLAKRGIALSDLSVLVPLVRADIDFRWPDVDSADLRNRFPQIALNIDGILSDKQELAPGDAVGDYTLLKPIGAGGMGTVWAAHQSKTDRLVAIKFIFAHYNPEFIRRFASERQALATFNDPNIAIIYDAGEAKNKCPFIVMELVEGENLIQYCNEKRLSLEARLELFLQACSGVRHAHFHGVVHRDLKPSNILVSDKPKPGTVKIIDFGMAKIFGADASLATVGDWFAGTWIYMSPEQTGQSKTPIDPRTDIFSLGIVLYQLLVDSTPISEKDIAGKSPLECAQIVAKSVAKKPSQVLNNSSNRDAIAKSRQTDVGRLVSRLAGELDWIVLKAIHPDRQLRYDTVTALAEDISRFLAGERVVAKPPSLVYVASKFCQKHLTAVVMTSILVLSVLIGSAAFLWRTYQRDLANKSLENAQAELKQVDQTLTDKQVEIANSEQALKNLQVEKISIETQNSRLKDKGRFLEMRVDALNAMDAIKRSENAEALAILDKHGQADSFALNYIRNLTNPALANSQSQLIQVAGPITSLVFTAQGGLRVAHSNDQSLLEISEFDSTVSLKSNWIPKYGADSTAIKRLATESVRTISPQVRFSPDGEWLIANDDEKQQYVVWNFSQRKEVAVLAAPELTNKNQTSNNIQFSHNGEAFVLASGSGSELAFCSYRLNEGGVTKVCRDTLGGVHTHRAPAIRENGLPIAAGLSLNESSRFYRYEPDNKDGPWVATPLACSGDLSQFHYIPATDTVLSIPEGSGLGAIGSLDGSVVPLQPKTKVVSYACTNSGSTLAVAVENGRVLLYNIGSNRYKRGVSFRELNSLNRDVSCLAFTSGGQRLAVAHKDGRILIRDVYQPATDSLLASRIVRSKAIHFSPNSDKLFASILSVDGSGRNQTGVTETRGGQWQLDLAPLMPFDFHFQVDAESMVIIRGVGFDGVGQIAERLTLGKTGSPVATWQRDLGANPHRAEVAPDHASFVVWDMPQSFQIYGADRSASKSHTITSYSAGSGAVLWEYEHLAGEIVFATPLNDQRCLIATADSGALTMLHNGRKVQSIAIPEGRVCGLAVSPNEKSCVFVVESPDQAQAHCYSLSLETSKISKPCLVQSEHRPAMDVRFAPDSLSFAFAGITDKIHFGRVSSDQLECSVRPLPATYTAGLFDTANSFIVATSVFAEDGMKDGKLQRIDVKDEKAAKDLAQASSIYSSLDLFEGEFTFNDSAKRTVFRVVNGQAVPFMGVHDGSLEALSNYPRAVEMGMGGDHGPAPTSLACSPDAQWLAGIGRDGTVVLKKIGNPAVQFLSTQISSSVARVPGEANEAATTCGIGVEWIDPQRLFTMDIVDLVDLGDDLAKATLRVCHWRVLAAESQPQLMLENTYKLRDVCVGPKIHFVSDIRYLKKFVAVDLPAGNLWYVEEHQGQARMVCRSVAQGAQRGSSLSLPSMPETIDFSRYIRHGVMVAALTYAVKSPTVHSFVQIWNVDDKGQVREVAKRENNQALYFCAELSPSGREIALGTSNGEIELFSVQYQEPLLLLELDTKSPVYEMAFSQRGDKLLLRRQFDIKLLNGTPAIASR